MHDDLRFKGGILSFLLLLQCSIDSYSSLMAKKMTILLPCYCALLAPFVVTALSFSHIPTTKTQRRNSSNKKYNLHYFTLHVTPKTQQKYNQQLGEFELLNISESSKAKRIVKLHDFSSFDPINYQVMWDIQKDILNSHLDRLLHQNEHSNRSNQFWSMEDDVNRNDIIHFEPIDDDDDNDILQKEKLISGYDRYKGCDSLICLQHTPVYTLGTASDENFIKNALNDIDIVRIERGGEVTYHGPGQLTVYPILDLRGYKQDIHWYMRALEEVILLALQRVGVEGATREEDVTGVWVQGKKIAALGIKVRRWITLHGMAINVDNRSLANFSGIVPCGLEGRDVCCINDFLSKPISIDEFATQMKVAFEEIFEVKIF